MRELNLFIKRLIDFFGSLIGSVLISPILIIIALLIKLTSKGPVFFKQERLGKDGKTFKILKFRTMVVNAEKIGDGLFVKTEQDNRITKIGKLLRATSLDELPQLWNVIVGDMSLVGPRPPVPYHPHKYEDYSDEQRMRNTLTWDERIELDIEYVENISLMLDLKILFKTVFVFANKNEIYNLKNKKKTSDQ